MKKLRGAHRFLNGLVCDRCGFKTIGLDQTSRAAMSEHIKAKHAAPAGPSAQEASAECRVHGTVPDDHFPCRVPGESADQYQNRLLGYWRDV